VVKTDSDLDSLAKSLDRQSAEIKAKTPQPNPSGAKPQTVNLSVKDVQSASQAQAASQANVPKKGLLGIFK
jgi:hypothetical protein